LNRSVDLAAAVFARLPRVQKPCADVLGDFRSITHKDVLRMGDDAERGVGEVATRLFNGVALELARSLCNAGPHVVDLKVSVGQVPNLPGVTVAVRTPRIPAKTYGDVIHASEFMPPLYDRRTGPAAAVYGTGHIDPKPPSLWGRFKAAVARLAEPIPYDGPRGWRDLT
jgi:hypothetical protein